jgi:L-glutamine synthetase (EC 6.3.1.2)
VDVKFADSFGQWHHITLPAHSFSEKSFVEGIPFDGSPFEVGKEFMSQTCF